MRAGPRALLCAAANAEQAQHLSAHLGVPGAPLSFLLQPMSPSPSRPCSLEAGTSPEARSPPSGCRPWPLCIPEADRGPREAGRHRAPNTRAGASLKGRPVHGGRQGPLTRRGRPSPRGGPALLWLCCGRAAGARHPGWAVSAPRGPRGPGRAWRRVPCGVVLPGGPRVHGTSPREP